MHGTIHSSSALVHILALSVTTFAAVTEPVAYVVGGPAAWPSAWRIHSLLSSSFPGPHSLVNTRMSSNTRTSRDWGQRNTGTSVVVFSLEPRCARTIRRVILRWGIGLTCTVPARVSCPRPESIECQQGPEPIGVVLDVPAMLGNHPFDNSSVQPLFKTVSGDAICREIF